MTCIYINIYTFNYRYISCIYIYTYIYIYDSIYLQRYSVTGDVSGILCLAFLSRPDGIVFPAKPAALLWTNVTWMKILQAPIHLCHMFCHLEVLHQCTQIAWEKSAQLTGWSCSTRTGLHKYWMWLYGSKYWTRTCLFFLGGYMFYVEFTVGICSIICCLFINRTHQKLQIENSPGCSATQRCTSQLMWWHAIWE